MSEKITARIILSGVALAWLGVLVLIWETANTMYLPTGILISFAPGTIIVLAIIIDCWE